MIRKSSPRKSLLAVGIILILGMSGCGTDNAIDVTENVSVAVAATGTTEETDMASGTEEDRDQEPEPTQVVCQEQTTADRMVDRTKVKGIYVTGPKAGSTGMEELIGLVDETELNAMVIDVKNDEGNVTFRLTNEEITENIPVLDQISKPL